MTPITKGNPNATVLLVGEYLGPEEVSRRQPFVGYSGVELDKMLNEAGIPISECFFTNILHGVPDGGKIENHFFGAREGKKTGRDLINGKYPDDSIIEGLDFLEKTIEKINPNLIISLGNTAMWALCGQDMITKWRGSILDYKGRKVIPTFNPAAITRNWPWRFVMVQDFRRAAQEMKSPSINYPNYQFFIHPSFKDAMAFLDSINGDVATDIETRSRHISCIGFATSKTDACCIPFMRVGEEDGYWTKEEETAIVLKMREVLTRPTVKNFFHNGHYDLSYITRYWGFLPNIGGDTMLMQHVCYPGMSDDTRLKAKALFFIASMYCDFYQFWKDEGKEIDTKAGEEDNWIYNCLMKGTGVVTDSGTMLIEDIVKNKLEVNVKSMNEETGEIELKKVTGWHKTKKINQRWLQIKVDGISSTRGLICTPDHEILTVKGRVKAENLTDNDMVFINEDSWSEDYFGTLCGTILGDSTVKITTSNKRKAVVSCTQISETLIKEKIRLFGGTYKFYDTTKYKNRPFIGKKFIHMWELKSSKQAKLLRDLCYPEGKKLAKELLPYLTTAGLALWYMDDGYIQKGAKGRQTVCCFAIHGFDDKEVIEDWFESNVGTCHIDTDGRLRLSVSASKNLCEMISPYVIEDFRYKLPYRCKDYEIYTLEENSHFYYGKVLSCEEFSADIMKNRGYKNIRYCLTIEDNSNFMTTGGLVSNCKDCVYTYECKDVLTDILTAYNLHDQYNMMMELYPIVLEMMMRGMAVDLEYRNRLDGLLLREMTERQNWIDSAVRHPLNPKSPKQMKEFFYEDLKIPPIIDRKTKKPTLNDEAIEDLKKRQPILRPLLERIQEIRSLNIFRSNFVKARLDWDDRMRFGLNETGAETFRFSSSKNPFDIGANMQTIPSGTEED